MIAEKVRKLEQENIELREKLKEFEEMYGTKAGVPKNCEYCNNFVQHYIRSGSEYLPTSDGCCTAGNRLKSRKTGETCKAFVKKAYGKNYYV